MAKKIVFHSVTKIFDEVENFVALDNLSFTIESGEIAAIYGPSGSGKSTILNIASGLEKPTSGEVLIGGDSISIFSREKLSKFRRQNIGFVFQSYNLFPALSAVENVELISLLNKEKKEVARANAVLALQQVGLEKKLNHRPSELSGGQQQRVAVARAIASKPKILFADEPTANLDSHTALALIDLLFELNKQQNTTIVFSTHDQQILNRVSKLLRIKDGILVSNSDH